MGKSPRRARMAWIEDHLRPGGVGRSERERLFWERVASGGQSGPARAVEVAPAEQAPAREPAKAASPWESAEVALVTLLSVVIFGLGWVTVELERLDAVGDASGSQWASAATAPGVGVEVAPQAIASFASTSGSKLNSWAVASERSEQ